MVEDMGEDMGDHKVEEATAKEDFSNNNLGMEIMVNRTMRMENNQVVVILAYKPAVQPAPLQHAVVAFVI